MAELEKDCVNAFKDGNRLMAKILLPRLSNPVTVTTKFSFGYLVRTMVSLLHLAAYWGWGNVVTTLVATYNCPANCKDDLGHIPLHYAVYNAHFEVVKVFHSKTALRPTGKEREW